MRERIATAALHAYPPGVRAMIGAEMLGTLLDASAASHARFAREISDLIRSGLRARATYIASVGPGRLVADGLCRGAILMMTLDLSTLLAQRFERGYEDSLLSSWSSAMLLAALALALVGYERLAGAGALAWTTARIPDLFDRHPAIAGHELAVLAQTAVPVLCFATLLLAPRRRAPDARRLAWLATTAVLVVGLGPRDAAGTLHILALTGAILVILAAIATLPVDPRLAIACALPATYVGVMAAGKANAPTLLAPLLLSTTPLALAIAVTRTRRLRHRRDSSG